MKKLLLAAVVMAALSAPALAQKKSGMNPWVAGGLGLAAGAGAAYLMQKNAEPAPPAAPPKPLCLFQIPGQQKFVNLAGMREFLIDTGGRLVLRFTDRGDEVASVGGHDSQQVLNAVAKKAESCGL